MSYFIKIATGITISILVVWLYVQLVIASMTAVLFIYFSYNTLVLKLLF